MIKKNLLLISPAFPPIINGLGDYCAKIGYELDKSDYFNIFYSGLIKNDQTFIKPYYQITDSISIEELVTINKIDLVFLNYSNYGYQKKGVPFWLISSCEKLLNKKVPLIIFFHEIYADGKIWQSSFWLNPIQKYIFKKIYRFSNNAFCSNEPVLKLIENETYDGGKKSKNIGIFSNVPEPLLGEEHSIRKNIAIVFGSFGVRKSIYKNSLSLQKFVTHNNINEIYDIGDGDLKLLTNLLNIPVISLGIRPLSEISKLMQVAKWGFIYYPNNLLGKSGIFASYCSHGLAIVNFNQVKISAYDDLYEYKNFININSYEKHIDIVSMSTNNLVWYKNRSLKIHTEKILDSIQILTSDNENRK